MPALYDLARDRLLPERFAVVGFARSPGDDASFREEMLGALNEFGHDRPVSPEVWDRFASGLFYLQSGYDDPAGYQRLRDRLAEIERTQGTGAGRLFYPATPPNVMPDIVDQLGAAGLSHPTLDGGPWARIILEKPF